MLEEVRIKTSRAEEIRQDIEVYHKKGGRTRKDGAWEPLGNFLGDVTKEESAIVAGLYKEIAGTARL